MFCDVYRAVEQEPMCAKCGKPCDESNAFKNRQGQWFHNACVAEHMSNTPSLGLFGQFQLGQIGAWIMQWGAKIIISLPILWLFFPELWFAPWIVTIICAVIIGTAIHFFPSLLRDFWKD